MGDPIRVLCVDDDPATLEIAASFLDRNGLDVVTETSARDALDRLDEAIDCIVSDYEMPAIDGLELLETVRDDHPDLPFILFTGKGNEAIASEAISAGVTDYLRKETGTDQYTVLANRIENAVEKRRAERELARTESRYRRLVEQTLVGIYIIQDDRIRYANPKLAAIFGYDPDELVGRSPLTVVAESDRDRVADSLAARQTGEIDEVNYTFTGVTKSGTPVEIEAHGGSIDLDGDPAVMGVLREVNDRHRREYALRALHDATGDLMRAHTPEAVVDRAVAAAEDVLGFPVAVIRLHSPETDTLDPVAVTETAIDVLGERPKYDRDEALPWRALESGEPVIADGSLAGRATNDLPLESALYVSIDDHGTLSIGSPDDTFDDADVRLAQVLAANTAAALDRVANEAELERQNERLEEFASVVSHDLRNPLGLARGRLELAHEEHPSEHHDDIQWALSRMDSLIEDLLALARQGEVVDETTTVSLATIAEAAWMEIDDETASFVHDDLGEIEADPDRLQRLFGNLFRNAVEHGSTSPRSHDREDAVEHGSTSPRSRTHEDTVEHSSTSSRSEAGDAIEHGSMSRQASPDDGSSVTVRVERLPDGGFAVADDGPGIPDDESDRVFESGYSTGEGTGLGLAIVRTIAEAHGWQVLITKSDTGGARIEVHTRG
ncbi:hybrid sensor histidine kinase/response regulator [Halococcus saccharolyticus]|uniref:histidine kinase n=1 Tax=Halococcus saccharolyticus DSM 5350 TaxID=1227455 RepID=M0MKS0_9EURY|nr:response regulator [Halococcus saccharolyticus]EMA46297.1 multi-sensor signal transduction histidine kinase [Halococcus saccharolyticus DSM 5350]